MSLNGMIKYSQFTFNHPASTSRNNAIGQHSGILEIISFMSVKHDTEMRAGTQVNLVGACLYILTPTVAFILLMQLVLLQAIFRGEKKHSIHCQLFDADFVLFKCLFLRCEYIGRIMALLSLFLFLLGSHMRVLRQCE